MVGEGRFTMLGSNILKGATNYGEWNVCSTKSTIVVEFGDIPVGMTNVKNLLNKKCH